MEPEALAESVQMLTQSSTDNMLASLSVLELTLLVAIRHLSQLSQQEPFNFEMVYSGEYMHFLATSFLCLVNGSLW